MFAYCNNSPLIFKDPLGTRLIINDPVSDFEYLRNYNKDEGIHYTASAGGVVAFGIGPLAMSLQFCIVSDHLGKLVCTTYSPDITTPSGADLSTRIQRHC